MQNFETKNEISSIEDLNNSQNVTNKKTTSLHNLAYTIVTSFKVGTFGFVIVLSLIIITKLLAFSTGAKELFFLNENDILFSSWGFIILSFSRFISFQKK